MTGVLPLTSAALALARFLYLSGCAELTEASKVSIGYLMWSIPTTEAGMS